MRFGWGLVAELERSKIYVIVAGIWIFQLILSSLVLRRFSPVEWPWRRFTCGKKSLLECECWGEIITLIAWWLSRIFI